MAACKSWREKDAVKVQWKGLLPCLYTKEEHKPQQEAQSGYELRQKMACKGCRVLTWLTSSGSYRTTGDQGHSSLKPFTMGDIQKEKTDNVKCERQAPGKKPHGSVPAECMVFMKEKSKQPQPCRKEQKNIK